MILDFITGMFKPVTDFIDDSTLSPEEKLELEIKMKDAKTKAETKVLDFQKTLVTQQTKAITAGIDGNSLQRSWRPILMIEFGVLLALHCFGVLPNGLPEWFGTLFMGLGGVFIFGRSAEKVVPRLMKKK